jgi:hypothetical protein
MSPIIILTSVTLKLQRLSLPIIRGIMRVERRAIANLVAEAKKREMSVGDTH